MAVNIYVYDLINYPGNRKTVTIDLEEIVPVGNGGEDVWVFSSNTTATASGGASIQKMYVNNTKLGWAKSSGLASGPYSVTGSQKHLKIAIDEGIADGVEIALETDAQPLSGEVIAKDMQTKLNNTAKTGGAKAGNLSYLNAQVTYTNNTFKIVSGVSSDSYTGTDRSSVAVTDGSTTTGLAAELGFDIPVTSESLAATDVKETTLAANYTTGRDIELTLGIAETGDCLALTDGTNTEYRGVESAVGTAITLSSGTTNTYNAGTKVQVLRMQDSTGEPPPAYGTIDDYIKYGIAYIANQINYAV